jgi:hypothetical protein
MLYIFQCTISAKFAFAFSNPPYSGTHNLETDQSSPLGGGGREGPQRRDELNELERQPFSPLFHDF